MVSLIGFSQVAAIKPRILTKDVLEGALQHEQDTKRVFMDEEV
jgi:hypothetical protein